MLKIEKRPYECKECGHQVELETNHIGECYPNCKGDCHQILEINHGMRVPKQTTHIYVGKN